MRRLFLLSVSALCIMLVINAKESYYYYEGKRIPIIINDDSISIYFESKDGDNYAGYKSVIAAVSDAQNNTYVTPVTSIEYSIGEKNQPLVKMSNRFYVQLYDYTTDVAKLQNIAKATKTTIIGQVPFMPDWYELLANKSLINNTLELSNYFYETGLFKNVDPGFIFNFTSSCVSDSHFLFEQWGATAINSCEAWGISRGDSNIKIAIIDGNIYTSHPEFATTLFTEFYNSTTHSTIPDVTYSHHGTLVCGIITSDHNHGRIAGMAPDCSIVPISYTTTSHDAVAADLASGFTWAVTHGADVINCSWGDQLTYTWLHSSILESAIYNALRNGRSGLGCTVIFSSGNQNSQQLDYPASVFADILTVGAITESKTRASFSSYGDDLDVVAPGTSIYSTLSGGGYYSQDGTSFSAPYVSGIAGLILSVNPYLMQKEVADIIESTTQKVGGYSYTPHSNRSNGTWNNDMGYGLVDAYKAVFTAKYTNLQGDYYMCGPNAIYLPNCATDDVAISWSLSNSGGFTKNIIVRTSPNNDTVYLAPRIPINFTNEEPNIANYIDEQMSMDATTSSDVLTVTVTNSDSSYSVSTHKTLSPKLHAIPEISASNSQEIWWGGAQRTFTEINCEDIPDSLLRWTAIRTRHSKLPTGNPIMQTTHHFGRSFSVSAHLPQIGAIDTLRIYVENLAGFCNNVSDTLTYLILRRIHLNTQKTENELNVIITEGNDNGYNVPAYLNEKSNYTLELWHSIYGRMRIIHVLNASEQIDTSGLPSGVYVLLLKENGCVISQTKMQL